MNYLKAYLTSVRFNTIAYSPFFLFISLLFLESSVAAYFVYLILVGSIAGPVAMSIEKRVQK